MKKIFLKILNLFKKRKGIESPVKNREELEPDRENKSEAKGLLWYPGAYIPEFRMPTKGKYKNNYPKGVIVHFTEGRSKNGLQDAINTSKWGQSQGFAFVTIANDGQIVQSNPLDEWGYHAGISYWEGLGEGVSKDLLGIEVCCAGTIVKTKDGKFKDNVFNEEYTEQEVRYGIETDSCAQGYYHKFTDEQIKSLVNFILWLKKNDPTGEFNFKYVLGHCEVSGMKGIGRWRKVDPSWSMPVEMPEFRDILINEYKNRYSQS